MVNLTKQFIKFCLVGLTNLVVQLCFYFILTRFFHLYYIIAAVLAFIVAVTWSFYINKKWTFKQTDNDHKDQYVKFFIANSLIAVISISLLSLFVEKFGIHDLLSQFLASVICAIINFTINRFWTFK